MSDTVRHSSPGSMLWLQRAVAAVIFYAQDFSVYCSTFLKGIDILFSDLFFTGSIGTVQKPYLSKYMIIIKVLENNTNLTFLYKIGINVSYKVSAKNKVAFSGN